MASELTVQTLKGPLSGPNANKILIADGHTIEGVGGKVLQVVQVTGTNYTQTTGTSWTSVAGTCSITPSETTSKVLIHHYAGGLGRLNDDLGFRLNRGGTTILENDRHAGYNNSSAYISITWNLIYLDSPSSTSQVDYTFDMKQSTTGNLRHNNYASVANTWVTILTEIAG